MEKAKKLRCEGVKHTEEEVIRLAKKIFKNIKMENRKNDYYKANSNSFNIKPLD